MKHIYTLGNYLRKAILYTGITTILLISLYGCGSTDNSSSSGPQTLPTVTIPATIPVGITATAGVVNTPLPGNIPLQGSPQPLPEYRGSLNGASATVWTYLYIDPSVTASSLTSFYTNNMPSKGWKSIDLPTQPPQGQSAVAFQQGTQTCMIAAGSSPSQPVGVVLTITLAG